MSGIPERMPFLRGASRATRDLVEILSPGTTDVVTRLHRAGPEEVAEAVEATVEAAAVTARMAPHQRAAVLAGMAAEVARRREEIARVLALEAGKPIQAARTETDRCVHTLQTAAEEAKRISGEILPLDTVPWGAGRFGLLRRFPLGPVAGITPFNFPLNLTAHKIAPALAAGNAIVVKPASQTPSLAILLAEIAHANGAPPGAVNVVPARAAESAPLVEDERLRLLSFTGSPEVGWDLKRRAPRKRVTLELGGNAGAIVCAGSDLAWAAERILFGGYAYAGQSCISVQRVFAEKAVFGELVGLLAPKVKALRAGPVLDEATEIGPMISETEAARAESWIREATASGAELAAGGGRRGAFLEPTLLLGTRPGMKVNCLEIFAPVVTIEPFEDLGDALRSVNDSRYGLQAGIFTRDSESAWRAWEALEVGGVVVNDVPSFRVDHMPYGGVKDSGTGREGLRWAIEEMTEPRLLVWTRRP